MVQRMIDKIKKIKTLRITCINYAIPVAMVIALFLFLPPQIQKSYSIILYAFSIVSGLLIGNLVSKVYSLKKKLNAKNEELIKKHENLQTYIGNVVHDLRSPAAAINMISGLLNEELVEVDPTYKELITSIYKSSLTMLDRICCILDNSRAQESSRFEKMTAGNPIKIIEAVINKHQILAIEKNIDIELQINQTIPDVYFDNDALESVFSNLISNAIKYSKYNTKVIIYNIIEDNNVTFCIKDQGLGMTKDDLSKVYGRYTKLSARPTCGEDSSGLGLSIVKELTEKMNGKVKAESEGKDKGSTFSVTLSTQASKKQITA